MKKLILSLYLSLLFFACSEPDARKADSEEVAVEKEAAAPIEEQKNKAYYPIPSPEQMFTFISDHGLEYNSALLHDAKLASNYHEPTQKALIFGIYTADLAYTAAYQDVETTIQLYKVVRKLSTELHIEELMTEEMMQSMQANMENPDSLALIAGDSYYQAVEHLESHGQEGKLALMSLAGWTESIYITFNSVQDINLNSTAVQRIAAQKITFGNLYTYLKKNEDKLGVKEELKKIQPIRAVFASLKEQNLAKKSSTEEGRLVFGTGNKISISMAQYLELQAAVEKYRGSIIAQNV